MTNGKPRHPHSIAQRIPRLSVPGPVDSAPAPPSSESVESAGPGVSEAWRPSDAAGQPAPGYYTPAAVRIGGGS